MTLFGTNGVRGIANEDLSPELSLNLARSLATFLWEKKDGGSFKKTPFVVLGTDTRVSGAMIQSAVASGLLSCGAAVIHVGIVPTPSLQYYVKNNADIDAGIIVTASHNPREYNGIKFIDADGTEFSRADEKRVEEIYESGRFFKADWAKTGKLLFDSGCNESYVSGILALVDKKSISQRAFKVLTDTGNGAGSLTMPDMLRRLGCRVFSLNAQPDGTFPWRNPEPVFEALSEASSIIQNRL